MGSKTTKLRCVLFIAASAGVVAGSATAADNDPLKLILAQTLSHDSNVFRTAVAPVADTIASTTVRLTLDMNLSRQHLQAALSQSESRYGQLSNLNNNASSYQFSWQGVIAARWATTASWARSESLSSFADLRNTRVRNIVTTESTGFRLGYSPHPDWPVFVNLANVDSSNSTATLAINDSMTSSSEVGFQYNTPLGNQVALSVRNTEGRYPKRTGLVAGASHQNDLQAAFLWRPGIKSSLGVSISKTHREQENLPQANFSGATGRLNFDWAPTVKTSVNATMGRELAPTTVSSVQELNTANFTVGRSYGVGLRWLATEKISTEARFSYLSRTLGGNALDTMTSSSLSLQYLPLRSVQMSLQLRRDVRESSNPLLPYTSNLGMLSATVTY